VGVDWASDKHDVLVQDVDGEQVLATTFAHDERGLRALCGTLVRLGVVLVTIERLDGLLIERLLDAGLRVIAMHPNQVAAARPRFRTSGGKSDRFDAFVLCELARTDHHRFRVLVADSDDTKALRALSRAREDLVQTRVALANQLRTELERFWPGAAAIFRDIDSPIGLAFLQRYPSPMDANGLGDKRLAAFLARHAYCVRKQPAELLAKLRDAPRGRAGDAETEARRAIVLALVAALHPMVTKISQLTSEIAHRVRAHPDGHVFLSLFKDPNSVVCAAALLAEIGDCRARYRCAEALAADAGMTPVGVESGKSKVATFRWGCDHRLRAGDRDARPHLRKLGSSPGTRGVEIPTGQVDFALSPEMLAFRGAGGTRREDPSKTWATPSPGSSASTAILSNRGANHGWAALPDCPAGAVRRFGIGSGSRGAPRHPRQHTPDRPGLEEP
jgi:transposase